MIAAVTHCSLMTNPTPTLTDLEQTQLLAAALNVPLPELQEAIDDADTVEAKEEEMTDEEREEYERDYRTPGRSLYSEGAMDRADDDYHS